MSDRPFKPLCYLTLHVILRITSICIASHCIPTCITIIAFLHASPSYGILICITVMLHSYMHYHYIAFLHALLLYYIAFLHALLLYYIAFLHALPLYYICILSDITMHSIFTRKAHFISSVQKISNCLLDARSEHEGCLRGL